MRESESSLAAFEPIRRLLQQALEQTFPHCKIESIPLKTGWQNRRGIFSSSLPFLCARQTGISLPETSKKLAACLPKQDRLFSLWDPSGGYLNFLPSDAWYTECLRALSQTATFRGWDKTEEDFGFFSGASPATAGVQKAFVRLCGVLRNCLAEKIPLKPSATDAASLSRPGERALIFALFRLRLAGEESLLPVLQEAAGAFCRFYDTWRVWSPDPCLTRARAGLCLVCAAELEQGMAAAGLLP